MPRSDTLDALWDDLAGCGSAVIARASSLSMCLAAAAEAAKRGDARLVQHWRDVARRELTKEQV
jgi:hypothetical protein